MQKLTKLPIIFTRGQVFFPGNESNAIDAGREFTVKAIESAWESEEKTLLIVTQRIYTTTEPVFEDVHHVGVIATITRLVRRPSYITIYVMPKARVRVSDGHLADGHWRANAEIMEDVIGDSQVEKKLLREIETLLTDNKDFDYRIATEVRSRIQNGFTAGEVADFVANNFVNNTDQKQKALELVNVNDRLAYIVESINTDSNEDEVHNIANSIRQKMGEESLNRKEEPRAEDEEEDLDTTEEILEKLKANPYPDAIKRRVKKELKKIGGNDQDRNRALEYIDWLLKIPYWQETVDNDDIENVKKVLDEDHYGLEDPKKRIVEYIAVKKMTESNKTPIICFYGPPGTGKTSLAKSIARALGRKLVKGSLGGVDDESKIRGFLRTYVGSQPGLIIQSMKRAGYTNPVFILDEVDKLGVSRQGDPASALLEVLDPEQNKQFNDHYIEENYDLSKVLFIATANYIQNIPEPLKDRMEMIYLPPYTEDEKLHIALEHLIPKQIEAHGLSKYNITFTQDAVIEIIEHYTLEAGVRNLDKVVASVLRKLSVDILTNKDPKLEINAEEVKRYLGRELIESNKKLKENTVGVVTGLSVVGDVGGDILPIEVTVVPGKGNVTVTGNLRDMIKESGYIAVAHVRSFAKRYGIAQDVFDNVNIHIHFPDAATKDGNSAGIAMTIGIISALTGRKVDANVAMTGEVSLMGKALPIGGVREKLTGALRAGLKTVMIPTANERDLDKVPEDVKTGLEIIIISSVEDAVKHALLPKEEVGEHAQLSKN